jgi:putative ABC transport system substrate-binding protein
VAARGAHRATACGQPDVILAFSTPATAAFQRETRTIPIVFIGIADAVGQGFVPSLTHPGGNLTGLTMYEASISGKWLEMLKEIEPQLARAAFVVNPKTAPYYDFYMRGAKSAGPSLGIEPVLTPIENDAADVERAITNFAHATPKGGLVVPGTAQPTPIAISSSRSLRSSAYRPFTQTDSSSPQAVS